MDILFDVASVSLQKEFVMVIEKEDGERGDVLLYSSSIAIVIVKKKKDEWIDQYYLFFLTITNYWLQFIEDYIYKFLEDLYI